MPQFAQYCLLSVILLGASSRNQAIGRVVHDKSDEFLLEIQPRVIAPGEEAVLRWSIKGATKVVIEEASKSSREMHKIGAFSGSGSVHVRPTEDTTYVVTCEGATKYSCASVSVRVRVKQRQAVNTDIEPFGDCQGHTPMLCLYTQRLADITQMRPFAARNCLNVRNLVGVCELHYLRMVPKSFRCSRAPRERLLALARAPGVPPRVFTKHHGAVTSKGYFGTSLDDAHSD
jgi:hypothetical protein